MTNGQTLTERTRALLGRDGGLEFTVSRTALETLVADSERYAAVNGALNQALCDARSRLVEVSHSHDGRIVWERVVSQLAQVSQIAAKVTAA